MAGSERLPFEDLKLLVAGLSTPVLEQLSDGPMPDVKGDGYDCRVCMVLGGRAAVSPPARKLKDWHEFFADTRALDKLISDGGSKNADDEWSRVAGELSYARCLVIYSVAQTELLMRALKLDEEAKPMAALKRDEEEQSDPAERRKDEEAEDAERRLDAQKAGDL